MPYGQPLKNEEVRDLRFVVHGSQDSVLSMIRAFGECLKTRCAGVTVRKDTVVTNRNFRFSFSYQNRNSVFLIAVALQYSSLLLRPDLYDDLNIRPPLFHGPKRRRCNDLAQYCRGLFNRFKINGSGCNAGGTFLSGR